jgi:hypothetical protein
MKNPVQKSVKIIQVFLNDEIVYTTKEMKKATEEVAKIQQENKEPIKIINHITKRALLYKKGRYDKNYKVISLDYNSIFREEKVIEEEIKE